jgi:hypothetical protein
LSLYRETILKEEVYILALSFRGFSHGQLSPLFEPKTRQNHHRGYTQQSRATHLMVARKLGERERERRGGGQGQIILQRHASQDLLPPNRTAY